MITSIEQALASLKVESFEIAGIARSGQASPVGKVAYVWNLRALCPVVAVTSDLPSPRAGFQMTMGVCVDGEPVGGGEGTLMMDRNTFRFLTMSLKAVPYLCEIIRSASFTFGKTFGKSSRPITPSVRPEKRSKRWWIRL